MDRYGAIVVARLPCVRMSTSMSTANHIVSLRREILDQCVYGVWMTEAILCTATVSRALVNDELVAGTHLYICLTLRLVPNGGWLPVCLGIKQFDG